MNEENTDDVLSHAEERNIRASAGGSTSSKETSTFEEQLLADRHQHQATVERIINGNEQFAASINHPYPNSSTDTDNIDLLHQSNSGASSHHTSMPPGVNPIRSKNTNEQNAPKEYDPARDTKQDDSSMPSTEETASSKQKKKPGRKKKKEGAPKRSLSAYNFFFQEERKRLLDSLPNQQDEQENKKRKKMRNGRAKPHNKISFSTLAKTIATNWKELGSEEMKRYEKLARKDTDRYLREKKVFEAKEKQEAKSLHTTIEQSLRFSRFPITQSREQQPDTANTSAYPSQATGAAQRYMVSATQSDPVNTNAYPFQTTGAAQTYMVSSREQRQGPVITSTSAQQTTSAQQANASESSVPLNMMPSQYSHLSYQTSGQSMASSFGNNPHQYYQAAQDIPYSYTNQFIQYQQALPESLSFQERQQAEFSPSQNSNVPLERPLASQADAQELDPPILYYFEEGSDSASKYIGK